MANFPDSAVATAAPETTTYPTITLNNKLSDSLVIYDAFNNEDTETSVENYFGTLTSVASIAANASGEITPIHGPISTYIIYDSNNQPVKRIFTLGTAPSSFTIEQADVDIITLTKTFVDGLEKQPDDAENKTFLALIKDGKATASSVNDFFKSSQNYQSCTFISYMLVVVTLARTPATATLPPDQQSYSLSTLLKYMGVDWPNALPDITISNFYCKNENNALHLGGKLNIKDLTFADGVLEHVTDMLPSEELQFAIVFNYDAGLSFANTTLQCVLDNINIPTGGGDKVTIDKPTIILSIAPLFKFVVFEVKATIPFSLFNSPTFNADIAMTIDNVEAEIGVVIEGNNNTLLTPPITKGLHFDEVGVGMGLIFEPPGFAIGVEGKFHIGDGDNIVALDDDSFTIVCELEEEVPNPLYLAFYVPKLDLSEVITIFTNSEISLDFPISFSDLSFRWAENPMEPVTLPDGSLAPMGYGFTAFMDLFGLSFFGQLAIDLSNGVSGEVTMNPLKLGDVFALTGEGKGVSIKVDAQGKPIQNNFIAKTAAEKTALNNATTSQLVKAGGPEMTVSTSSSPYFTLDAELDFIGFKDKIDASIASNGISFELDFGSVISTKMACVLKDYHNFSGNFSFGPDFSIPLPTIAGVSLGHISLTAEILADLGLTTSTSDIDFSVAGGFDFEGLEREFGPVNLDINISSISDIISAIGKWIEDNVAKLFADLLADAEKWAKCIYSNVILPAVAGVEYVTGVLKDAFGKTAAEMGDLLKGSAYALDEVASAIKNTFSAAATDVSNALVTAYQATSTAVTNALHAAGYAANDIAQALSSTFSMTAEAIASALNSIGYGAEAAAKAISSVFTDILPSALNDALQGAGYAASAIESAFNAIGGAFASFAEETWEDVKHYINPSNW